MIERGPLPICRRRRIRAWDSSHARAGGETKRADPEIGPCIVMKPMWALRWSAAYLPDFVWLGAGAPELPALLLVAPVFGLPPVVPAGLPVVPVVPLVDEAVVDGAVDEVDP